MIEVMQKVSEPQVKERDLNDLVEKFMKRFPPEFYGVEDPTEADEWTVQIEKIFEVFKCTGKQRFSWQLTYFEGQQKGGGRPLRVLMTLSRTTRHGRLLSNSFRTNSSLNTTKSRNSGA